jgi:hypothetical protein
MTRHARFLRSSTFGAPEDVFPPEADKGAAEREASAGKDARVE